MKIIVFIINQDENLEIVTKDYEDFPLRGPTSVLYYQESNILFICDAGYFGSTNLNKSTGSVYYVDLENKIVKPLLINCLSYPSDICVDNEDGRIYITETYKNRILRIIQSPFGTYHTSVFHQFNGRLGPSAICLATFHEDLVNYIFVARYEYQNNTNTVDGTISILNKDGILIGELTLPTFSEITSILITRNDKEHIYFTDKNNSGVYKATITGLIDEIKKLEESQNS